jgi:hypothetical protein
MLYLIPQALQVDPEPNRSLPLIFGGLLGMDRGALCMDLEAAAGGGRTIVLDVVAGFVRVTDGGGRSGNWSGLCTLVGIDKLGQAYSNGFTQLHIDCIV